MEILLGFIWLQKKLEFLTSIANQLKPENILSMKSVDLMFCGKGATTPEAKDHFLPIKLYDCPQNFSTVEYFDVKIFFLQFNVFTFYVYV